MCYATGNDADDGDTYLPGVTALADVVMVDNMTDWSIRNQDNVW